jgi:hypothetical protein
MNATAKQVSGLTPVAGALAAAQDGFWQFPVYPDGAVDKDGKSAAKRPRVKDWQALATRDPLQIERWAEQFPGCNFGTSTSKFGPAGDKALIVVDVDVKNGKAGDQRVVELELEGKDFPSTRTHDSPSGGWHWIYAIDNAVKQGVDILGSGLDIRSHGGLILTPGSWHHGKQYRVRPDEGKLVAGLAARAVTSAPAWLIDACGAPRETSADNVTPLPGIDPVRARQRAVDYLQNEAPEAIEGAGGDATTYAVAAKVFALGVDNEPEVVELMMEHWHEGCGWTPGDLAVKVRNARNYKQQPTGADAPEAQFTVVEVDEQESPPGAPTDNPFKPLRVSDLRALPWPEWTVRNVIPAKGMGVIFGPSKSGKTFLALDIACACVRGVPWAGLPTRQGVAVYIGLEGQARTRAFAYAKANNLADEDLADLIIFEQPPLNLLTVGKGGSVPLLVDSVRSAISGRPVALTIVDTLAQATPGGDENSSVMMGAAIGNAKQIARALGGTVVLIHHSGKNDAAGARGHSSLVAAADFEIQVTRPGDGVLRSARVTKVKDAEDGAQWTFQLGRVDLGFAPAADGGDPEARTSCVVADLVRVDTASAPVATTPPRFSTLRALVFRAFTAAAGALDGDAIDWDNTGTCSLDAWESAYFDLAPLKDSLAGKELTTARNTRSHGFKRSVQWLTKEKWVTTVQEKGRTRYRLGRSG